MAKPNRNHNHNPVPARAGRHLRSPDLAGWILEALRRETVEVKWDLEGQDYCRFTIRMLDDTHFTITVARMEVPR